MSQHTLPSEEDLREYYVGKDLNDVPKPSAVLDAAIIKRHCEQMLRTMKVLNVGFRAHVKTHKTHHVAALQVGDDENSPANFIASTVFEIESLQLLFAELGQHGRAVNVLYGIPLPPSQVERLAAVASLLGKNSVTVMIDHPDQLAALEKFAALAGFPACVFLKIDTGYHRAGLPPASLNKNGLLEKLAAAEQAGHAKVLGLYSHSSLSYAGTTADEAMNHLVSEITGCVEALKQNRHLLPQDKDRELVISVGASPQVVSSQNLVADEPLSAEAQKLKELLRNPDSDPNSNVKIELHAGVYPILDMQQLSTNARGRATNPEHEVAISVLAEVCSVYNDGERSKPEALLAAGTLALGREPCPSYRGWGTLSSWRQEANPGSSDRLIVDRISQEHAIVSWEHSADEKIPLHVGQTVKIFPNHACITSAYYEWYLVVDSEADAGAAKIVDVWVRARGLGGMPDMLLNPRR
ncbi:hypothetical protein N7510_006346 [Penicillium lagena]|uniref:uncharacterized protein n=1 Tax=Penicillium lagena TaxID=94218 RepID=UPI0025415D3F|nr:uncharacterized protein N7510_006346 [Penicillium lagena]KAJ5613152.1 hypothetical protein N7510_006346 [Penicillium lagena]